MLDSRGVPTRRRTIENETSGNTGDGFLGGRSACGRCQPSRGRRSPRKLLPDGDGAGGADGNILSDRFDGVEALAHLTVVAPNRYDARHVVACPVAVTSPIDDAELATCNVTIGADTDGKVPTTATLSDPADEAYEVFWDIPNPLDQEFRDILALACVGDATTLTGPAANCRQTLEQGLGLAFLGIQLDDAQGGSGLQATAGEMFQICTPPTSTAAPLPAQPTYARSVEHRPGRRRSAADAWRRDRVVQAVSPRRSRAQQRLRPAGADVG
jgi:hypothetical protein